MAGILLSRVMQCLALQPTEVCMHSRNPSVSLKAPKAAVLCFCPTAVSHRAGILLFRVMQCLALLVRSVRHTGKS